MLWLLRHSKLKPAKINKDKKIDAAKATFAALQAAQAKWKTENPDPQLIIDSNGERAYRGD